MQPFLICGIVRVRVYIWILSLLLCFTAAWAEDSIYVARDTLAADSIAKPQEVKKKSALSAPVHYQSSDSMVMMANGTAYLHGKGELKYEKMELTSDYIRMNIDSSLIYARGVYDSLEYEWKGKPVFKDGKDSYETNEITYNIKTQKGYIRHVVTQQGEGYIIADKTKKVDGDEMMMLPEDDQSESQTRQLYCDRTGIYGGGRCTAAVSDPVRLLPIHKHLLQRNHHADFRR